MRLLELFWSFFQIGLFSIGGGMAALPLIQSQVVELHGWLTLTEFTDLITIAEMTPGPIAINSATFVGTHIAGMGGALTATLGCVLPSCVIVLLLAKIYAKYGALPMVQGTLSGLRPAVVALIASAGLSILLLALFGESGLSAGLRTPDWLATGLFLTALLILRWKKPNPIYVMVGCGIIGAMTELMF